MAWCAERAGAALLGLACLLPFGHLALLSAAGPWPFPHLVPDTLTLARWSEIGPAGLWRSLGLSLGLSSGVALASTALGCASARAIAAHPRRGLWLGLAYVPFAISPVVLGVCLLHIFLRAGLAGTALGVALAQVPFGFAYAVIFWVPFWTPDLRAMEHLVASLGGGPGPLLRRVLFPVLLRPLRLCLVQTFLGSWFHYGLTSLVGAGKVDTLTLRVYGYLGEASVGTAAAAGVLLVLPPMLLQLAAARGPAGLRG